MRFAEARSWVGGDGSEDESTFPTGFYISKDDGPLGGHLVEPLMPAFTDRVPMRLKTPFMTSEALYT